MEWLNCYNVETKTHMSSEQLGRSGEEGASADATDWARYGQFVRH
jgi:hypothetical protein